MAAKRQVGERIDHYLRWVRRELVGLPGVERGWEEALSKGILTPIEVQMDQGGFRDEWSAVMGLLEWLCERLEAGQFSTEQQQQYAALLPLIREMLPIMERLRLELPPVPVLAALAEQPSERSSTAVPR